MNRTAVFIFLIVIISLFLSGCRKAEITVKTVGRENEVSREILEISIRETGDSIESAKQKAEITLSSVEEALNGMELNPEDFSISSSRSGEYEGKFFFAKDLQVFISGDFEREVLIEGVTSAGASGVHSFFGTINPETADGKIPVGYDATLAEVKLKAERIAGASNGRIGRILSIEESEYYDDLIQISVTYEFIPE